MSARLSELGVHEGPRLKGLTPAHVSKPRKVDPTDKRGGVCRGSDDSNRDPLSRRDGSGSRLFRQRKPPSSREFSELTRHLHLARTCQKVPQAVAMRHANHRCVRFVSACSTSRQQESADLQALRASPLPDSNRRPPPYHAIQTATGGSRWQRFRPRSSRFSAAREPNVCHPLRPLCSITVPSQ